MHSHVWGSYHAKFDDDDFNSFRRIACEGHTHTQVQCWAVQKIWNLRIWTITETLDLKIAIHQKNFTWHSRSWSCTTIPSLAEKASAVQKIRAVVRTKPGQDDFSLSPLNSFFWGDRRGWGWGRKRNASFRTLGSKYIPNWHWSNVIMHYNTFRDRIFVGLYLPRVKGTWNSFDFYRHIFQTL